MSVPAPDPPRWVAALLGAPGVVAAFVWGVAEGTFFFLMPDLLITLAALFSPRASLKHLAAVVAGALVGGLLLFSWAARDPIAARSAVARVPFVSHKMFEKVADDFRQSGVWAPCLGPFSGIPYKVYAAEAPAHVPILAFLLASIPARLERLVITWGLFAGAGWLIRPQLPGRRAVALAGYLLYWVAVYAYYWTAIANRPSLLS